MERAVFCTVPTEHALKVEGIAVARMIEKHVAREEIFRGIYSSRLSTHLLVCPSVTLCITETE
jgi:hypothetical protein